MSVITTTRVERNGQVIDQAIPSQLDVASLELLAESGGEAPYDRYILITIGRTTPIRRQDLLIDEQNVDPETNELYHYRVIGDPEHFTVLTHTEAVVERIGVTYGY